MMGLHDKEFTRTPDFGPDRNRFCVFNRDTCELWSEKVMHELEITDMCDLIKWFYPKAVFLDTKHYRFM